MKDTLKNNEHLLEASIQREEKLQNKYRSDIVTAVKLNRELNDLVSKKNIEISEIELLSKKKDLMATVKISDMQKQSANLHIDYSKYLEIYDKELKHANKDKKSLLNESSNKINELEEQKLKTEYKVNILEEENKTFQKEFKKMYDNNKTVSNKSINQNIFNK